MNYEARILPLLDSLCRVARTLTNDEHESSDLVQTTCMKAMEKFNSFSSDGNFLAWVVKIMRNTWIDQLRHHRVTGNQIPLEDDIVAAIPDAVGTNHEFRDILFRFSDAKIIASLMELPEPQRMALLLSDVEGLGQDEVADVLGVPVGTVRSRVSRARALLRERLEHHARELGFLERRQCI